VPQARIGDNEKNKANRPNAVTAMDDKNQHSLKQNGRRNRKKKRKRRNINQREEAVAMKEQEEEGQAEDGTEAPEIRGALQQKAGAANASQGKRRSTCQHTQDPGQNRKPGSMMLPLRVTRQETGVGQSSTTG